MDLTQSKLTRAEWETIEIPVSEDEKQILHLIIDGYSDVNVRRNSTLSLLAHMKLDNSPEFHAYLYKQYFEKDVQDMTTTYVDLLDVPTADHATSASASKTKTPVLKSRDLIRLQSMDAKLSVLRDDIFEFILLRYCQNTLHYMSRDMGTGTGKRSTKVSGSGSGKDKDRKGSTVYPSTAGQTNYAFYLYTLLQIRKATVPLLNTHVLAFVDRVIATTVANQNVREVLQHAHAFIEKNPDLLKYEDRTLFDHQKRIFSIFRQSPENPALVLYTAPTGTGKTLTPLGLSEGHRIIFICAARHVGLALAKSAISAGKRIAIAFGCETASDIRLHYFAASEYTRNRKSGGIGKVDNSVGDKVQIMICDVQSYLISMHYMLAFSPSRGDEDEPETNYRDADLITYWDEPTITMDYEQHPLHALIHRNWTENKISKVVLSCATLPTQEDIQDTVAHFRATFDGAAIHTIASYDCRKSISLLNKDGYPVVPHVLFRDYGDLQRCVDHCTKNKTLLRYFDLPSIVRLIDYAHSLPGVLDEAYSVDAYFVGGIRDMTMNSLKIYYLDVLRHISAESWPDMFDALLAKQVPVFGPSSKELCKIRSMGSVHENRAGKALEGAPIARTTSMVLAPTATQSLATPQVHPLAPTATHYLGPTATPQINHLAGILFTTQDAHTLTDGPTIFLTEDPEKIGRFYVQQSQIPARVFQAVAEKIAQNSAWQKRLDALTHTLEDKIASAENKEQSKDASSSSSGNKGGKSKFDKKSGRETISPEIARLSEQIEQIRAEIKIVSLDAAYIPNTQSHQRIWNRVTDGEQNPSAFVPSVDEQSVRDIMGLGVTDEKKLLLLMGIGMFIDEQEANKSYMEIMKRLANRQQLFIILAASDYIYGTNYQFCLGLIGKDLTNMTQPKTIQAMGRIGRNQMQQEYTIRFRDDAMVLQLFQAPQINREAIVMSRLFADAA